MRIPLIPRILQWLPLLATCAWLAGCATAPGKDYSAYRAAKPASILVLPPINDAPEVQASASVLSQATLPLAEAGYYVSVEARLVDLRTGTQLWDGRASASNQEGDNNSGGGLIGMLVTALVNQVVNSATDAAHPMAGVAINRLLAAGTPNGLLYGPRSPLYGKN